MHSRQLPVQLLTIADSVFKAHPRLLEAKEVNKLKRRNPNSSCRPATVIYTAQHVSYSVLTDACSQQLPFGPAQSNSGRLQPAENCVNSQPAMQQQTTSRRQSLSVVTIGLSLRQEATTQQRCGMFQLVAKFRHSLVHKV